MESVLREKIAIFKSDMHKKNADFVKNCVIALYARLYSNNEFNFFGKNKDPNYNYYYNNTYTQNDKTNADIFCEKLQHILNTQFSPNFNVIVGNDIGFACKYKKKSLIILKCKSGSLVIIYKTPPREITDQTESREAQQLKFFNNFEQPKKTEWRFFKESTKNFDEKIKNDETFETKNVLKKAVEYTMKEYTNSEEKEKDFQHFAVILRFLMTKCTGPMWHIIVGRQFSVCFSKAVIFESILTHKHFSVCVCQQKEGQKRMFETWINAVPYFAFALLCSVYLARRSLCHYTPPSSQNVFLRALFDLHNKWCAPSGGNALYVSLFFLVVCSAMVKLLKGRTWF